MEDQFSGRTDDDLFYDDDDFEPVNGEATPYIEPPSVLESYIASVESIPIVPIEPPPIESIPVDEPRRKLPPPKTLANSRFADKPAEEKVPVPTETPIVTPKPAPERKTTPKNNNKQSQKPPKTAKAKASPAVEAAVPAAAIPPPVPTAPTVPDTTTSTPPDGKKPRSSSKKRKGGEGAVNNKKEKPATTPPTPKPPVNDARTQSGANPRQKLTEAEITAKMEKMKLLSEEKTRKFEKANQDQKQHEEAYARGMEEARKKRLEEAERKRRADEERRQLDDERAKNRERKLKAMKIKEGGWDAGKHEVLEEETRRTFRGANGGIRGARGGGLKASRFAKADDSTPPESDSQGQEATRERGNGRRGAGNGRGRNQGRGRPGKSTSPGSRTPVSKKDDLFPHLLNKEKVSAKDAVPKQEPAKTEPEPVKPEPLQPAALESLLFAPPPASGNWGDEVEEYEEMMNAAA